MREITELRTRFGGDKHAINRHSVRYYEVPGVGFFGLDLTLDGSPPFYTLCRYRHDPRTEADRPYIPQTVTVGGERYWGDGLGWVAAEELARDAITQAEGK